MRIHVYQPAIGQLTILAMSLAAIQPALAQEAAAPAAETAAVVETAAAVAAPSKRDTGIETVVVTAQKRTQNIKEVPLAITVVNAAQLERAGVKDIGDLAKTAAALEFGDQSSTSGPGGSASIRGIGTAVMTTSAEGSVGVVVDGVPQGSTASGLMLDLARVEVLRGPQGTLFGKNASAGVLNMSTQAPMIGDSGGNVQLEYKGTYGAAVRSTVNLPINDISALRISGLVERNKGVYRNVYNDKDSVADNAGIRLRYLLRPNSDLSINLIGEASNNRVDYATFFAPAIANATNTAGNHRPLAEFAACGVTVSRTNNQICSDALELSHSKVRGVSGQVDWTLANGSTLTSITAWRERNVGPNSSGIDMSLGYDKIRNLTPAQESKQFSQELRIASPSGKQLEYVAGLFYADSKIDKQTITTIQPNPMLPAAVPRSIVTDTTEHAQMTTKAIFGQATWRFAPATSLIAGLRYTRDAVSANYIEASTVNFAAFSVPTSITTASGDTGETNVSGKVGLQHTLSKQANVYATVSRGYKGPQIDNSSPVSAATAAGAYSGKLVNPELPTSVELGTKLSLLERKLDVDLALFHTKIKDFQEQNCTLTAVGALSCIPLNVPEVTSKGFEADLRARPLPQLQLGLSMAVILDTAYPTGFIFDGQDVGGRRLLYSPKQKVTASADYSWDLPGEYELRLGGDLVYKSRVRYCNSVDDNCSFRGHTISSLRLSLNAPDNQWSAQLYARNLNDTRVPNAIIYPLPGKGAGSGFAYGLGENSFRRVGVTLDYRF
ncbi:TonB-dependent receptor [Pseudoduganella umbonata]|uniref:Iron complex outermembrane receptor protein n=1 Tax=Pseudoduganella umbonata TaxID=864828 RepID=A0A4P8HWA0_9BURK|nr:TonB-dependent receptor [Pseudoduganella umbonata]MBB3221897.1 iron complex outermembrane receptor protein [Pseudoduganella umbonata]QCP14303.1 TonB-dependent receptor [Pseudoduganella umbonata]